MQHTAEQLEADLEYAATLDAASRVPRDDPLLAAVADGAAAAAARAAPPASESRSSWNERAESFEVRSGARLRRGFVSSPDALTITRATRFTLAKERQSWWKASSPPFEPPQVRQSPRANQKGKIMPSLVKRHEKLRAVRKKLAATPAEKN